MPLRSVPAATGRRSMASPVYKVIEIVGTSATSVTDAIDTAIKKASESVRHLGLVRGRASPWLHQRRQGRALPGHLEGRVHTRVAARRRRCPGGTALAGWRWQAGHWYSACLTSPAQRCSSAQVDGQSCAQTGARMIEPGWRRQVDAGRWHETLHCRMNIMQHGCRVATSAGEPQSILPERRFCVLDQEGGIRMNTATPRIQSGSDSRNPKSARRASA